MVKRLTFFDIICPLVGTLIVNFESDYQNDIIIVKILIKYESN